MTEADLGYLTWMDTPQREFSCDASIKLPDFLELAKHTVHWNGFSCKFAGGLLNFQKELGGHTTYIHLNGFSPIVSLNLQSYWKLQDTLYTWMVCVAGFQYRRNSYIILENSKRTVHFVLLQPYLRHKTPNNKLSLKIHRSVCTCVVFGRNSVYILHTLAPCNARFLVM